MEDKSKGKSPFRSPKQQSKPDFKDAPKGHERNKGEIGKKRGHADRVKGPDFYY